MALSPNEGGSAQGQPFTFTSRSVDRIAAVVRKVEAGNRDQLPTVTQGGLLPTSAKVFRVATFTGSWAKGSAKTVTFINQTTTPNTASATNLFASLGTASGARNCAIAKDGTAWYLIAAEC